jgi:hypothetical protein
VSDIVCAVCGEPWFEPLDMLDWQKKLFRQGAGCPCCEGQPPITKEEREQNLEAHLTSVMMDSEEPEKYELLNNPEMVRIPTTRAVPKSTSIGTPAIKWKRPEDKLLWTCAGCKVEVRSSLGDEYHKENELYWDKGEKVHYHHGVAHAYGDYSDDESPSTDFIVIDGKIYCPGCAMLCDNCGGTFVFRRSDLNPGDPYEAGYSSPSKDGYTICTKCLEEEGHGDDD